MSKAGAILMTDESVTLRHVLDRLEDLDMGDVQMCDMKSAVITACRWFGASPEHVPADSGVLRERLAQISPGTTGVTRKRMANVRWSLGRVLKLTAGGRASCGTGCSTVGNPVSEEWAEVLLTLDGKRDKIVLGRFARFCSSNRVPPDGVCDDVGARYREYLEDTFNVRQPDVVSKRAVKAWNRFAEAHVAAGYGLLTVPDYSAKYVLSWSHFPASLSAEIEAYLHRQATTDPFDLSAPLKPLKPSTVKTYRDRLLRFASCLVFSGVEPTALRSLEDLIALQNVMAGLRYLVEERNAGPLAGTIAGLLASIAKHCLGHPDHKVAQISRISSRLLAGRRGLSAKVRQRLLPLKNEATLAKLLLMPSALARSILKRGSTTRRDAVEFQRALALAILTVCPLRVGSLCRIRLDQHMHWSGPGQTGSLILDFKAGELKNSEPASFPLPDETTKLIRRYITEFRPHLDPGGSQFLFPGRDPNRHRDVSGFSSALTEMAFQRIGVRVNPHLYRHIVHLVVLRRFPGAYAMVARILTHRSIATTTANYAHFDAEVALRAYQRLVSDACAETLPVPGSVGRCAFHMDLKRAA